MAWMEAGAAIPAVAGVVGGWLSNRGGGAGQRYESPTQMMARFGRLNPWLYGAMTGQWSRGATPTTGLGQYFSQMVNNPGYIDPRVMNMPFTQIERGADTALQRTGAMIGRSNSQGGLANFYALANMASRGNARANVAQQYVLQREQQRRADLAQLMNWMYQAQGMQGAQYYQPPSNSNMLGNLLLSGLAAYGGMR